MLIVLGELHTSTYLCVGARGGAYGDSRHVSPSLPVAWRVPGEVPTLSPFFKSSFMSHHLWYLDVSWETYPGSNPIYCSLCSSITDCLRMIPMLARRISL